MRETSGDTPQSSLRSRSGLSSAARVRSSRIFLLVRLLVVTVLVVGTVAQDSAPHSQSAPWVDPQQPASPGTSGPSITTPDLNSAVQPQGDDGQFVFKKKVEEVVLRAVVVDQQNNLISNLDRNSFNIYEDGKLQKMTSFRQENVPLALGILIDNSGSMLPKRRKVNDAALNLVRSSNTQDEVFVVNFGEDYYLDQDFTGDVVKLKAALNKVETRGSTALYDAIVASAAHIRQDAKIQKRVLLVVTDGRDNASEDSLDEAVQQLQRADGPVVYVIGFVDQTKRASSTMRALQAISRNTGGTAYFPQDLNEVDAITRSIASDIRSQYVLGYKSSNPGAGHIYHTIDVQASDTARHKLRVRTRSGYYSESAAEAR